MRWLFNSLLVIVGVPLFGNTVVLIGVLFFGLGNDKGPSYIFGLGIWLFNLVLFAIVYIKRTKWLKNIGIFKSWSNFEAYMIENHGYPEVSDIEKEEFLSWAELSEERPKKFRKTIKNIYRKINSEIQLEGKKNIYIKCLAWYSTGWPVHDGCYDFDENDEKASRSEAQHH